MKKKPAKKSATGAAKASIEYLPISEIETWPQNAKDHSIGDIYESMKRFGYVAPMIRDETTGRIVAGHGRLKTIKQIRERGEAAPQGIVVKGGEWLIPVVVGLAFKSEREAEAYLIADNQLTIAGGWDDALLADALKRIHVDTGALLGSGFDADDLDELLKSLDMSPLPTADAPESKDSKAKELQVKWKTKVGQLWQIGDHRLLIADCTVEENVRRLMDGKIAALVSTDPPYGVSYSDEARAKASGLVKGKKTVTQYQDGIENDAMSEGDTESFLIAAFNAAKIAARPNAAWFIWHGNLSGIIFAAAAAAAAGILVSKHIVWCKPTMLFGFGNYHWQHEMCIYGWLKGNKPEWYGEDNSTSVWHVKYDGDRGKSVGNMHPTQKPIELFSIPIKNHTKRGEIVYEPFSGSGSQFVAAQQLERICYGSELDPRYASVVLERMSDMGLTPQLSA